MILKKNTDILSLIFDNNYCMSGYLRISNKTKEKFDKLKIEMWWIEVKTHDDKINHLIWFYKNFKNNNK